MKNRGWGGRSHIKCCNYRHILFYCSLLYCISQVLYFFFFFLHKLMVVATPSSKSSVPFFQNFLTLSLLYFGNFRNTENLLITIVLLWWSVISNLWQNYHNCFGVPKTTYMVNLICVCILTALPTVYVPIFLSLQDFLLSETQWYWN